MCGRPRTIALLGLVAASCAFPDYAGGGSSADGPLDDAANVSASGQSLPASEGAPRESGQVPDDEVPERVDGNTGAEPDDGDAGPLSQPGDDSGKPDVGGDGESASPVDASPQDRTEPGTDLGCDTTHSCPPPPPPCPDPNVCACSSSSAPPDPHRYAFCNERTFADAKAICEQGSMHLAIVDSEAENEWLTQEITSHSPPVSRGTPPPWWLGGHRGPAETWSWVGSSGYPFWIGGSQGSGGHPIALAFAHWVMGEPSSSGDCLADLVTMGFKGWEAFDCTQELRFICEE